MKAVVFHGVGDIRLEDVPDPRIQAPTDAIIKVTASAICGTDLHMIRGTLPGLQAGTVLGHEAVGVVEEIGPDVRNLSVGDRVVVPSTIACGVCAYCRDGCFSQCDTANPNGKLAGTAFFGGPSESGPFHGLQAERARIPYANVGLVKLPDEVSDEQAVLLSDVFPTGWYGAELAHLHPGATVTVLGCGPVGQFAIASAKLMGAGRIFAVDCVESRLDMARRQGAEVVNFEKEDPVETIRRLTDGIGTDRVIDAVGVDACRSHNAPPNGRAARDKSELDEISNNNLAPNWNAGDAPTQALDWAIDISAKAGGIAIVGVYPSNDRFFPIGRAMNRNLSVRMGNTPHRRFIPMLVDLVRSGVIDPRDVLTQQAPLTSAIEAYRHFDRREAGWMKVELLPMAAPVH
ncbi:MAG: zinc-dependent alcohol dehydrogenase [Myxococcota bacterium]